MIQETNYTVFTDGYVHTVTDELEIVSHTVLGVEAMLHSIWVLNGRVANHFYELIGDRIYLRVDE